MVHALERTVVLYVKFQVAFQVAFQVGIIMSWSGEDMYMLHVTDRHHTTGD